MTEYRIKKGGREFSATRVETLEELLRRGLLRPSDSVSVNGGDYVNLSDLQELRSLFDEQAALESEVESELSIPQGVEDSADDPWRHWSNFESDEGEDQSEDDVLASFLGQVELSESGTFPVVRRSHPKVAAVEPPPQPKIPVLDSAAGEASPADPDELRSAGGSGPEEVEAPDRIDPVPLAAGDLEFVASPAEAPPSSPDVEALSGPSSASAAVDSKEEQAGGESEAPDLPVSFRDWLKRNESGDEQGERLERFGRYDDGIVRAVAPRSRRFNIFGVLFVVFLGTTVITSYYVYVRTAASSSFPKESELETRMPGAVGLQKPSSQLASLDTPVGSAALQLPPEVLERRAREKAVRQRVRRSVIDFTSAETLEDALFQELTNAGSKPLSVSVEPLGQKGTSDKYNRRPTRANLTIALRKVSVEGDAGYGVLEERLIHSWLMVGKYASLGRVQFVEVTLTVAPPLAWSQQYAGRELALLWEQQIEAEALFPKE